MAPKPQNYFFATHKYDRFWFAPLQEIISQYQIKTIVLGYPKHMNNTT
ncbi:hypothetical protein ACEW7V_01880 [Areca yellow leaf disease phytoplasma]